MRMTAWWARDVFSYIKGQLIRFYDLFTMPQKPHAHVKQEHERGSLTIFTEPELYVQS